jgi:hypothetical protein
MSKLPSVTSTIYQTGKSFMKLIIAAALALSTTACVSYYDPMQSAEKPGETVKAATLIDSAKREGGTRVQLFYVSKVNGKVIENALNATSRFNYGKGLVVQAQTPQRFVPANRELPLEICAETYNGAPILDLLRADAKKCETLTMTFEADKRYYVTGLIEDKAASVRITEDLPANEEPASWDGK